MNSETLNKWYSNEALPDVFFYPNDSVALRNYPFKAASIISLESINPEPTYLLEDAGGDSEIIAQSDLGLLAYVELLNEGTQCWRPVAIEKVNDNYFKIVSIKPDDEEWSVSPGDKLKLIPQTSEGNTINVVTK
jgi:hypothetical protein